MKHSSISAIADDPRLASQVQQSARNRLHRHLGHLDEMTAPSDVPDDGAALDRVHAILRARRLRDRFFDEDLFADPAWDILLELYAAHLKCCRTSVSSLCIGAAVPATTALRWIKALERRALIVRTADPADGRRVFVALSAIALTAMDSLFRATPPLEPLL
jgi:DNA-binding MarR family transcriptional regulator